MTALTFTLAGLFVGAAFGYVVGAVLGTGKRADSDTPDVPEVPAGRYAAFMVHDTDSGDRRNGAAR